MFLLHALPGDLRPLLYCIMDTPPIELFRRLTNGVYVIGVAHGDRRDAFTAAWLTQVSFSPLLLALSINPDHASYPLLVASKAFAVSVLPHTGMDLARHFGTQSGHTVDKLDGQAWTQSATGLPVLQQAVAHFDCAVQEEWLAGDHRLVVATVVAGVLLDPDALPLRYSETGNMDGSAALYPPAL